MKKTHKKSWKHHTACSINYHKRISRYDSEADEIFLFALMSFYCESLESEKSLLLAVCACVDERNYIDKRKLFTLSCLIKKSSHSFPQKHFYLAKLSNYLWSNLTHNLIGNYESSRAYIEKVSNDNWSQP